MLYYKFECTTVYTYNSKKYPALRGTSISFAIMENVTCTNVNSVCCFWSLIHYDRKEDVKFIMSNGVPNSKCMAKF